VPSKLKSGSKPAPRLRPPKPNIPQTKSERDALAGLVRSYVKEQTLVPPVPMAELRAHGLRILEASGMDAIHRDYAAILINNELWREPMAAIPFHRRLLLVPKCLRDSGTCKASFDEFGLICKHCGRCTIPELQAEAEQLGYAVLVAEGSALVMAMIQTGRIDAIVGVSCFSVLERAFPYIESAAVPGIAIPLLQDDCRDTAVDMDWVWDAIHLTSADQTRRMDLNGLRSEVDSWFHEPALSDIMGPARGESERYARAWLAKAGKRWRPFLAVAAYQALKPPSEQGLPADLRKIAVAVECFHKASLIHDDIEDDDDRRYGEKTLHAEHGVPVALNIGDLLIGEGYRMIALSGFSPEQKACMMRVSAEAQRSLCQGQGAELLWRRDPRPLSSSEVVDIFKSKTAPAFEVALLLGAISAGQYEAVADIVHRYSDALGVAYQIQDDLEDSGQESASGDFQSMRPNILAALAWEQSSGTDKEFIEACWRKTAHSEATVQALRSVLDKNGTLEKGVRLLESYKEQSIRSLAPLGNASLKGLLRRVIGKIFDAPMIRFWCHESST
jgi:geranylgeranyl pyrophosphate synthase